MTSVASLNSIHYVIDNILYCQELLTFIQIKLHLLTMSKFYIIIAVVVLGVGLLISCFAYVIHTERKIKELTQENLILQSNAQQAEIEKKNNEKIISTLNSQIQQQKKLEIKKQQAMKADLNNIKQHSTTEKVADMNAVFQSI